MFFFYFGAYYGRNIIEGYLPEVEEGDLIESEGKFLLCLGKKLSFKEKIFPLTFHHHHIIQKNFLGIETMRLIHWMVYEWYSSYKKILALFLDDDIEMIVERGGKERTDIKKTSQTLIVFPDLRTMANTIDMNTKEQKTTLILHGQSTKVQRQKAFRSIKKGEIEKIICTGSQVFHDRAHLEKIFITDSHKRYYKSQQEPRYHTSDVLRFLAQITNATFDSV